MPGIPREFAEHSLEVFKDAKPVQQAVRRYSEPRRRAIGEEVTRLLAANFIREIKIATWLANPVLVAKKNKDKLRMCINNMLFLEITLFDMRVALVIHLV